MRYPQGDLAIGLPRSPSRRPPATCKSQPPPNVSEDGPRKRTKNGSAEGGEAEDEKKRSRGRPRLETRDETAAERRRTQIRLAQRAYRNRKENAIQTLEQRVQQLKDSNEEMSNAFMQLHDFAVNSGLLDGIPDFGRQLRATTEKFLALARVASDDGTKDGEVPTAAGSLPADDGPGTVHARADSPGQAGNAAGTGRPTVAATATATETDERDETQLSGGITITHEPVIRADSKASVSSDPLQPTVTPTWGYEVVTHPTLDNASFPFQTAPGLSFLEDAPTASPYLSLPLPDSYASMETTLGRRLQRYTIECALVLISMPQPPEDLIARVFGFCLLFETRDQIKRRLSRALTRTPHESLYNWEYPFYHLGRAGTHFDATTTATTQRIGNQGTHEILKPRENAGFAPGPFTERINSVRDRVLDTDMYIALPGFTGEYLDCDDAEMYLYQRGVVVPPGADVVAADIDPNHFVNGEWQSGGNASTTEPSGTPPSPPISPAPSLRSGATLASPSPPALPSAPWPIGGAGAGFVDPTLGDVFSQSNSFMQATTTTRTSSAGGFGSQFAFSALPQGGGTISGIGTASPMGRAPRRQRVIVDVLRLVRELAKRGICLGRTPGFKQADVNAAFWASARRIDVM
ncbi:hypothetical protein VTK56DRAFT_6763 [Thermocarpiscus australiensis]